MSKLTDIVKVSKTAQKKLRAAGIASVADLVNANATELAEATGLDVSVLLDWQGTGAVYLSQEEEAEPTAPQAADVTPSGAESASEGPIMHLLTGVKRG